MSERLTQKQIAERLGLTDRRVRQLIKDLILPGPDAQGRYDWPESAQRYHLYTAGTPAEWSAFFDEVEAAAKQERELYNAAVSSRATKEDVGAFGRHLLQTFSRLRFATAVHIKSESDRALHLRLLDFEEAEAMGYAFGAVDAFNARHAKKGTTPRPIVEQLRNMESLARTH